MAKVEPRTTLKKLIFVAISFLGLLLLAIAIGALATIYYHTKLPSGSDRLKFDSVLWCDGISVYSASEYGSTRQLMLSDLVKNILPGKTGSEIEQLLGPPCPDHNDEWHNVKNYDLIYETGPPRDGGEPYHEREWLVIWLDPSAKFARYEVRIDRL